MRLWKSAGVGAATGVGTDVIHDVLEIGAGQ